MYSSVYEGVADKKLEELREEVAPVSTDKAVVKIETR